MIPSLIMQSFEESRSGSDERQETEGEDERP